MPNYVYPAIGLIGGTAGFLDAIDGTNLADKDMAYVTVGGITYNYILDVDSALAESSPNIIAPDANGGDKRWILQGIYAETVNATGDVTGASGDKIFAGVNATNAGIFSVGGGKTGGSAVSLADNQSITITFSPMGALLSIGNNHTGHAALFFVSNASGTITALADVGAEWDLTDVDNAKLAIWKGGTNDVVYIKNYTNATRNLVINVLGAVITSSTAPA